MGQRFCPPVSNCNDGRGGNAATLLDLGMPDICDWFGDVVDQWRHLRTYRIAYALPRQRPPALSPVAKSPAQRDGHFVCGDYLETASIQGAMISGRRAAEQIIDLRPA